jgi:uroporphyrinogen decarboxylase
VANNESRERVLTALKRQQPDRVPFLEPVIAEQIALELLNMPPWQGGSNDEINQTDAAVLTGPLFESPFYTPAQLAQTIGLDGFGMYCFLQHEGIKQDIDGRTMIRQGGITTRADMQRIHLPDPDDPAIYAPYRAFVQANRDTGLALYAFLNIGSDPLILGMGLENFAIAVYEQPDLVVDVFDLYTDWYARAIVHLCEAGFDFIWFADDIAYKTAPYVSPRMFHELFLPRYRKVVQHCTLPWIFHSDGNLMPIMKDLLSLGMSALHPLEPDAMDLAELKRSVGSQVCLVGNISVDRLSRGNPREIDRLVQEAISIAGSGGGYILSSSNSVTSYCKADNVRAMITALRRYGAYPLQAGEHAVQRA